MSNLFKKKNFYILASIFVLMLFAYIACKTPLAGDDWGYALNGTVKPDIVAPGVNVLGPKSADTLSEGAKADNRNQYIYMTGTSVAAAVTAGGASLITQWEERQANSYFVDTRGIKSLIIRGAKRDSNYVYPNRIQGYGKLDILGVFEYLKGK